MAGPGRRTVRACRAGRKRGSGMNQTAVEWLESEFDKEWDEKGHVEEIEMFGSIVRTFRMGDRIVWPFLQFKSQNGIYGDN